MLTINPVTYGDAGQYNNLLKVIIKDLKPQKFQNWLKILKKVLNWW